MSDAFVEVNIDGHIAILTLNRPEVLNALSPEMLAELCDRLEACDRDPAVRAIVITGGHRAFAAGADIQALARASVADLLRVDTRTLWQRIRRISKPLIAAVSGFAYGGGCELAMSCDLIVASETARFAQPEIRLGIMPGAGGTQRLARAMGPYRAMEMILTGEPIGAAEAKAAGLVNRVVPVEQTLAEARSLAHTIASRPPVGIRLAREALRVGLETTMQQGMVVERRNFLRLFETRDKAEGMAAFLEKRDPHFTGE